MHPSGILHLRTDEAGVVLDVRGPGLPSVVHWGAPLGDLDGAGGAALLRAIAPPQVGNAPDVAAPPGLVPDPGTGYSGRPGLRGHRSGADWAASFTLDGPLTHDTASAAYRATDASAALTLTGELHLDPSGLLRLRHTLRNDGDAPYVLDGLEAALPVPRRAAEILDFTGRWSRERHPQRHPFPAGAWVRESRRGRTGHDATIGLLAGTPGFGFRSGEVWGVHVAWSGDHVTYAERRPEGGSALGGGELLLPGEMILAPGGSYTTPWIHAAYSARGLDGIAAAFHRRLRARPGHPGPDRPRPVVLNTWEAVYFDHDPGRLLSLARTAAGIGVERFVLDDGWFRNRRDDTAGLGDWHVDRGVWPDGLHPLVDGVRDLGMEFGLWVEPEMVSPDSDLYRAHPGWALRRPDGALPVAWRHQQVLDLAHPGAYAHILGRLDALLSEYAIGYLKWDHNRDLVEAGHQGRAGVHTQTRAVYRLLDELRARHPRVEIESCSSGGGRVDLEILERTDRVWASDCIDPLERQTVQLWTGLFLPPELVGAHVGSARSHTTGRTHDLSFRVATALFGHFGIEWDITRAPRRELERLAGAIALYKELRPLLHSGDAVHADLPGTSDVLRGTVAADRSEAVFCLARLASAEPAVPDPVPLPGLDPACDYEVALLDPAGPPPPHPAAPWAAAGTLRVPGRVLTTVGLRFPALHPEQACLVRVRAVR
ncbi:alpha-galactosidase [Nocardiopsis mangrovi]|uniref:alpha-galactosidase n=1 Tax=Nocardiopsis mangrovi TaxID=1179818 RepID=A0ABV9E829_9ACTN